jgi:Ni,Fe-hydrogenase I cytochrome b subunit
VKRKGLLFYPGFIFATIEYWKSGVVSYMKQYLFINKKLKKMVQKNILQNERLL